MYKPYFRTLSLNPTPAPAWYYQKARCSYYAPTIYWQSKSGKYFLLRHPGHYSHRDKKNKISIYCQTKYHLFDIKKLKIDRNSMIGANPIYTIIGRLLNSHVEEIEAITNEKFRD